MAARRISALIVSLFLFHGLSAAQDCALYEESLYRMGDLGFYDYAFDIEISGNHVCVANYTEGLRVIDVSDPWSPVLTGTADTPGYAYGVALYGGYAFVADYYQGLQVIDINAPSFPVVVGGVDTPDRAWGVAAAGNHAYVADYTSGLQVIDISDPSAPAIVGAVDTTGYSHNVAVGGSYAYVAHGTGGFLIVDVVNPANPVIVGMVATPGGNARDVALAGSYAYVADAGSGLQVIDVGTPSAPLIVGNADTPGYALGVTLVGSRAYVADQYSGLQVVDVSDPTDPILLGGIGLEDGSYGVVVSGDNAFVADGAGGLQVVSVAGVLSPPAVVGSLDTDNANGIARSGDYAYVADYSSGLLVVDISDPSLPVLAGLADTPSSAYGVALSGDYAFVADGSSGLQIVDIGDPAAPLLLGGADTPNSARSVAIRGDCAFVADYYGGLQAIDVSDPSEPMIVGSVDTPSYVEDVVVSGYHAYLVGGDGLQVVDIGDPSDPSLVGGVDVGGVRRITVAGDYAYLSQNGPGLKVMDIADPSEPVLLGAMSHPQYCRGIAVEGNYAYVANANDGGLAVADIRDPALPPFLGGSGNGDASDVVLAGDHVLVTAWADGLQILPRECGAAAAFSADPWTGYGSVQFTDLSYGGTSSWLWDFGDGGQSTDPNPLHTYVQDGLFSVTLIVDGADGSDTLVMRDAVRVLPEEVVAGFVSTKRFGESPLTVEFLDKSTGLPVDSIRWNFGGTGTSTADRVSHVFTGSGDYWVELAAFGPANADTAVRLVEVREPRPLIVSVSDVPGDQGGRVYLDVLRSIYDDNVLRNPEIYTVQRRDNGNWVSLVSAGAYGASHYYFEVNTLADSTAADPALSEFRVIAFMEEGNFASDPAWGYSVDNIAPAPPANLRLVDPVTLAWDESAAEDFQYFSVYGSSSPEFDSTATLIDNTIETTMDVGTALFDHYHVTATDDAENEGNAASVSSVSTGVAEGAGMPGVFALRQVRPNPLERGATIVFDLPRPSHVVLQVFDVSGRLIRSVVDGEMPGGHHGFEWNREDDAGRRVASGVYFVRFRAGDFEETKRAVVLR